MNTESLKELSYIPLKIMTSRRDRRRAVYDLKFDSHFWKYIEQSERGWPSIVLEEQLQDTNPRAYHVWESTKIKTPQKTIAMTLGCSVSTVKRLLNVAKSHMERAIDYDNL